jgi:uncharacterized protein YfaP (DUF2135 family)
MKYALFLPLVLAVVLVAGCTSGPGPGNGGGGSDNIQISGLADSYGNLITNGGTTSEKVHTIQGTIDNFDSSYSVVLVFNSVERYLDTFQTSGDTYGFSGDLVLKSGTNTFVIKVVNTGGVTVYQSSQMSVTANIPVMDIRAVLTWNTDGNDVDLRIIDPDGNSCYYLYAGESNCGGMTGGTLDIDDTDGYGPETFTLTDAIAGTYTIKVRYYGDHGVTSSVEATVSLTLNEGTPQQLGPHTFTQSMANGDSDDSNDWVAHTFSVPGA